MSNRPLILVTNDDGASAKGLRELTEVMQLFGEVLVIAPEVSMSGMSNAITVDKPLRTVPMKSENGLSMYKCNGTPVDCVKLAFNELTDRVPDYVVSGINHGANSSISVIYSGTLGAAIEGSLHGVSSLGFSLCDFDPEADFSRAKHYVARIFQSVIERGLPHSTCLNVNIPQGEPKGIKICRQTGGKWVEEFEKRTDPHSRDYFWLSGYFKNFEPDMQGTDISALEANYVSIVPVRVDMTCYDTVEQMKKWNF